MDLISNYPKLSAWLDNLCYYTCRFINLKTLLPPLVDFPQYLMFVIVNFDALVQANDIRIKRRQVVFLCWIQDSSMGSLRHLITSRLNAHSQTDWAIEDQAKNLNSTARLYDGWAFSPLDFTAVWLLHLALAIYMFVVVNFDALPQASNIRISISHDRLLFIGKILSLLA